jgi:HEAT repeat protein
VAAATWSELLVDPSRTVRRAAVDAVVGAERESLRPLLEQATTDTDPWIRWKSLHGLAVLGVGPSLATIERLHDDPDFRVRLEAANARNGVAWRESRP